MKSGDGTHSVSSADLVRDAYAAMMEGRVQWLGEHTSPSFTFLQGDLPDLAEGSGSADMFGQLEQFLGAIDGRVTMRVRDLLTSVERVAAILEVTIDHAGRTMSYDEIHLWLVRDGQFQELYSIHLGDRDVAAFLAGG